MLGSGANVDQRGLSPKREHGSKQDVTHDQHQEPTYTRPICKLEGISIGVD